MKHDAIEYVLGQHNNESFYCIQRLEDQLTRTQFSPIIDRTLDFSPIDRTLDFRFF